MAKYRDALPQLKGGRFITDGGIETTLIFRYHLELPLFATFHLLREEKGRRVIQEATEPFAQLAVEQEVGLILETVTWRASRDYGRQLGYSDEALAMAIAQAVSIPLALRQQYETDRTAIVISGNVGPRGDGYRLSTCMTPEQAAEYHDWQVRTFAKTEADLITGATLNYAAEAIGLAEAARAARMPVVISFTVETNGRLPSGEALRGAIETVDATTNGYPSYYQINCAYPTHFESLLNPAEAWTRRLRGIRANASPKSHAELNASISLDEGDPEDLAAHYAAICRKLSNITILGGCCGTSCRHVQTILNSCR